MKLIPNNPNFSKRLISSLNYFLMLQSIFVILIVLIYFIFSTKSEINLADKIIKEHLKQNVYRMLDYGEVLYLQSVLNSTTKSVEDNFGIYVVISAMENKKILAYSGKSEIVNNLFVWSSTLEKFAPHFGKVGIKLYLDYKNIFIKKIAILCGLIFYFILIFLIYTLKIRNKITVLSINVDELEKIIRNSDLNLLTPEMEKAISIINEYTSTKLKMIVLESLTYQAKQVAHDIRSPLSALNMVMASAKELPEDKRLLIRNAVQRINDIANDLLEKGKQSNLETTSLAMSENRPQEKSNELISALVDIIVSEKRIQYREKSNILIEAELGKAYGLFSEVYSSELKRAISNSINNSVEAFEDGGRVIISVEKIDSNNKPMVQISIKDNGKGIPPEVLSKIGELGFSHGKESTPLSGSGLGVAHAKKLIHELGGEFKVESQLGKGTEVIMKLPLSLTPTWFLEKIKISANTLVVSVDDDLSIHQIWNGRLKSTTHSHDQIAHMSFTSIQEFKAWHQKTNSEDVVYLVDYEFLGQKQNGLELIEELQIQKKSVLVTSRFEEPQVKEKTEKLSLKMVPKILSSLVPIEITAPPNYDYILIDDDSLIHMMWDMAAQMKNKKLIKFKDSQSFLNEESHLDRAIPVYIDVDLKGESGLDLSHKVHALGFSNIYLCTGYSASSIDKPSFIIAILGKDFPG